MEATIHTNKGDIRLELFPEQAPNTVKNFTSLAQGEREWIDPANGQPTSRPLFNGTIFHRVIDGSQFCLTVAPTPWLTGNHTIFGEVIDEDSKRVVDAIATTRTGRNDRPVEDVVIESIDITE